MKLFSKLAACVLATSLVGCGGGGGGLFGIDLTSYGLLGFAAKGVLKFATVEVYSLDASGNQTLVKTGETLEDGSYTISDVGTAAGQRYIVKIKPNSRTVHVDELLGNQTLPSDFVMTAVTQTDSKATTASVTPFSHMMVEAAKNAPGGLNSSNITQAQSTITELLGFNPTTIAKNDGASNDAQKLTIMLTAVSQMAKDGALGCTGSASDKTACVTKTLAAAASTTTLKLETKVGGQTVNVSSAFVTAVNTTLQDPKFQGQSALVVQAINKLNCTTNCTPATPQDAGTLTVIGKIKNVIDEIRTDLTTLFSSDGATSTSKGKINAQAFKFKQSFDGANLVTDQVIRDLAAMDVGIKLYRDYIAGRTSTPKISTLTGNLAYGNWNSPSVFCNLYQDNPFSGSASLSTAAANARFILCNAYYAQITSSNNYILSYGHAFVLTPTSTDGVFNYSIKAVLNTCPPNSAGSCNPTTAYLQDTNSVFQGSVSELSRDSNGRPQRYALTGELPPGFQLNYSAYPVRVSLVRTFGKDRVSLNAQVTENSSLKITRLDLSGTVSSLDGSGNKLAEISLKEGSFVDQSANTAKLDLAFSSFSNTNTATLNGVLMVDTPATDKSLTSTIPTHMQFSGTFSNTSGGVQTDFLKGVFDVNIKNYNNFDFTKPASVNNTPTEDLTFTGSLTAPDQPRLELIFSTSGKAYNMGDTALATSLTYNRYVGTTSTRSVVFTITRANATAKNQATVSEATSGFSMSFTDGDKTTKVYANGSEVGTLDLNSGLLTFKDGSIVSLDIQL